MHFNIELFFHATQSSLHSGSEQEKPNHSFCIKDSLPGLSVSFYCNAALSILDRKVCRYGLLIAPRVVCSRQPICLRKTEVHN